MSNDERIARIAQVQADYWQSVAEADAQAAAEAVELGDYTRANQLLRGAHRTMGRAAAYRHMAAVAAEYSAPLCDLVAPAIGPR